MTCLPHHLACDCREHKLAVLNKAALDAASALDWIKNTPGLPPNLVEESRQLIERVYRAAEALGVVTGGAVDDAVRLDRMAKTNPTMNIQDIDDLMPCIQPDFINCTACRKEENRP